MQNLSKFRTNQRLDDSSLSHGYFLRAFKDDKRDFMNYKLNSLYNVSEERIQEMEILEMLEKLGFPVQDVGTYFFKNMIVKAIHHLDGVDDFGNSISQERLLREMKSPYSQFYVDVARNDLDIGIKTFHLHIEHTLSYVNYVDTDATLLFEIYSNFSKETDYGEHAFIIAKHMKALKQKDDGHQYLKTNAMIPAVGE